MKPFLIFGFLLALALPSAAAAEPGTATRYLMSTPVSMLDFGIYKLDERLNRFRDDAQLEMGGIRPLVSVSYDYETDKIVVQYRYVIESLEAERYFARKDRKKEVKAMLDGVKRWYFGVDPETGAFLLGEASSLIYSFAHEGYVQKGAPEDLDRRLDERAEIRIAVFQDDWNSLQCRSMLLEKQVYCRDWQ